MKHYHFYTNFHQWFYKWYLSLNYRINDIRLSSSVVLETRPKPIVHHEPDVWDSTCGLRAHAQRWELTLWIDRLRSKSTCRQLSGVQFSIFSENLILDILARVSHHYFIWYGGFVKKAKLMKRYVTDASSGLDLLISKHVILN